MFERFTEKSRRVIFFARYEAAQFGSSSIEAEHILLGLLREDKPLTNRFLRSHASVESIRNQIEKHAPVREKVSTSVDLPLSMESKRILAYAAEESERLSHRDIGPEHLLLGILREEKCFAAEILRERGLSLSVIREELARQPQTSQQKSSPVLQELSKFCRDLTQAGLDQKLDPLLGREGELETVIEILGNRNNKNPVLVGEYGAGKTAIVEGLAQRIADGEVPTFLEGKRILAADVGLIVGKAQGTLYTALSATNDAILFMDELPEFIATGPMTGAPALLETLRPALLRGEVQCITACTPSDYIKSIQIAPWLGRCFRRVEVLPISEEEANKILFGRKDQYEKFHAVTYTDNAILCATRECAKYFPDSPLIAKATEIIDAAGARLKLRVSQLPEEVVDVQKRIKFIVHRMENSIGNREFEKARFYSDEERKERDNLRTLREKYHLDEASTGIVNESDIQDVISRWAGTPLLAGAERSLPEGKRAKTRLDEIKAELQQSDPLKVFLCHASEDKRAVRALYKRLMENGVKPWLDEEDITAGKEWDAEIVSAVRSSDVVVVCLSPSSINKSGFLQKEIQTVLDVAEEKPQGTIFVIPVRLEECGVPDRLRRWQYVNYYDEKGFEKLMQALAERSRSLARGPTPRNRPR